MASATGWEMDFNWNEIIGNMHRRFFLFLLYRLQSFHDRREAQLEKLRLIYLQFFFVADGSRLRFFLCRRHPASIKAPEKCVHWNLFPVNSLNNLHHVARLTSLRQRPFFPSGLWRGLFPRITSNSGSGRIVGTCKQIRRWEQRPERKNRKM